MYQRNLHVLQGLTLVPSESLVYENVGTILVITDWRKLGYFLL